MIRMIAVVAAAALIAPPAARAETIVFQRKGDIWAVQPDGGGERQVTRGGGYAWPSAADDGTIAALAADGRIHRFAPSGAEVGAPTPTQATVASDDLPADPPTHVRLSPDGRKLAYDEVIDGEVTTLWTPAGDATLDFPNQATGQEGLEAPSWIGSDRLLLSLGFPFGDPEIATFSLYDTAGGDDSAADWFGDPGSPWATGFAAAAARAGTRVAALEDDGADDDGTPTRVALRLFTADAPGGAPVFRCELPLPADDSFAGASPSFSADGTRLAWAQRDGIHVATLGDLSACGAIRQRTIGSPGDTQPYWTPAGAPAAGGGGPSGGGGPRKLRLTVKVRWSRKLLLGRGVLVRVTCSEACAPRARLRLGARTAHRAGTRRRAGGAAGRLAKPGTLALRVKLRPAVAHGLRRLPGFRVHLRVSAPGAAAVQRTLTG